MKEGGASKDRGFCRGLGFLWVGYNAIACDQCCLTNQHAPPSLVGLLGGLAVVRGACNLERTPQVFNCKLTTLHTPFIKPQLGNINCLKPSWEAWEPPTPPPHSTAPQTDTSAPPLHACPPPTAACTPAAARRPRRPHRVHARDRARLHEQHGSTHDTPPLSMAQRVGAEPAAKAAHMPT